MSDDWQPGDLALCVCDDRCPAKNTDLPVRKGRIYTVVAVGAKRSLAGDLVLCLALDGVRNGALGLAAKIFRKIHPHKPDEEDAETIRLLSGVTEPA